MSKQLQIKASESSPKTLSKEQKRFNNYVRRIQQLRNDIEIMKQVDLELRRVGDERVMPAEKKSMTAIRDLVFALDRNHHLSALTAKQLDKFHSIMLEEISHLLQTHFYSEDEELEALYEKYSPQGQSWEEAQQAEEEDMERTAYQFFNEMYGTDFDAGDFGDATRMKEKMDAHQAAFDAERQARAERQSQRKKSERQLAAESKRQSAEEAVNKTAKQIYRDLIRHFHPDQEQDEEKRLEKTEIMKQITVAYDSDDHLKLLELQMTLLSERDNVFAKFDESQLKYLNEVLKKQVQELEVELEMCSPEMSGNIYAMLYHPVPLYMRQQIERHIKHQKQNVKLLQEIIELIQTPKGLKQYVKEYQLEEDEEFDDIPPELLEKMGMFKR